MDRVQVPAVPSPAVPTPTALVAGTGRRWQGPPLTRRRRWLAWALCVVGLPVLTALTVQFRATLDLAVILLIDLALVLVIAALGGLGPGLVGSLGGFALTNWYVTPPLHRFAIANADDVAALVVFVAVAVVVSALVDRVARASVQAERARAEAAALAGATAALVAGDDPLPALLDQLGTAFGASGAAVLERDGTGWRPLAQWGPDAPAAPDGGASFEIQPDDAVRLVVAGTDPDADTGRLLAAVAGHVGVALRARALQAEARRAEVLAETDALRTALLQAVSHDLRTPLATIKACASGLLGGDATFDDADRDAMLGEIDTAADRLDRLVGDLLDMSRLQAGAVVQRNRPVALEEVVAAALDSVDAARNADRVAIEVPDDLPLAWADPGLLERALANLVSNALAWSPPDATVLVEGRSLDGGLELRVVDHGPGLPPERRARMFEPFQRFGDRSNDAGAGLGLAIAKGFLEAVGATIATADTAGGGLTVTIRLRTADAEQAAMP